MPELVNISVGSLPGTSGLEGTTVCPLDAKKSRKVLRMSATVKSGVIQLFLGASHYSRLARQTVDFTGGRANLWLAGLCGCSPGQPAPRPRGKVEAGQAAAHPRGRSVLRTDFPRICSLSWPRRGTHC